MCASTDEEEHVVHGPQPLTDTGKSRDERGVFIQTSQVDHLANLTKNIYVYPIANYYKNVSE